LNITLAEIWLGADVAIWLCRTGLQFCIRVDRYNTVASNLPGDPSRHLCAPNRVSAQHTDACSRDRHRLSCQAPWLPTDLLDIRQTGAWTLADARPLPPELEAFLEAGSPPV
jgi:hypothetical protein